MARVLLVDACRLRAAPGLARALLVALEGRGASLGAGFDPLLPEPVNPADLGRALDRLRAGP
jgi:hypothetical protein